MNVKEILKKLSESFGISGTESEIIEVIQDLLGGGRKTKLGGLIYKLPGDEGRKKIGVFAHVDEIGLVVTKSAGDGFFYLETIGGVDPKILPSSKVKIYTKDGIVRGVIGIIAPHLTPKEERGKVQDYDKLLLDATMSDWRKIKVGDRVVLDVELDELSGGYLTGKALDNRAGCTVLIGVKEFLEKLKYSPDVYLIFSTQEEIGGPGARTIAYELKLDYAIVIDVTFAEKVPGYENIKLKNGPAVGVGPFISKDLVEKAFEVAKKYGIKHQLEALPLRTGTDTDAVRTTYTGVKTLLLSVPILHMHTPVEVLHPDDLKETARLISHFISEMEG